MHLGGNIIYMNKVDLLKRIASISDELDQSGYRKESKMIDGILVKMAQWDDDSGSYYDETGDDYNRWEEEQVFRDHEGRDEFDEGYDEGQPYLTIERGAGATYSSPAHSVTLYYHDIYPEGSVLEGQERRVWVEQFEDSESREENIRAAMEYAKENYPDLHVEVYEGSSYSEPYLGHLPDDEDY